jgi:protein-S-isoprenylcysteine O-methyltransferase Ste14
MAAEWMTPAEWTRLAILYVPMMAAILAWMLRDRRLRQFVACLLSLLWAMTSLLALQRLNEWAGWWTFFPAGILFCGMPLELYAGWIMLWGVLPQLALPRLALGWCVAVMVAVDLVTMPMCRAAVSLGPLWLVGEAMAVVFILIPSLYIARWTLEDSHLRMRAVMQVIIAGMLFLVLVPEMVFALRPGRGWEPLLQLPSWRRQLGLQILLLMAVPGVGAVMEFAERGFGTPIPHDPPKKLVISGIYRYSANPMQLSCGLVMLFWAVLLHNRWLALGAVVSFAYSAGIAEWDEGQDLARRFGSDWQHYRAAVRNWRLRWKPYHSGPMARLYLAQTCGPCSELRSWLVEKDPLGLAITDAETLPRGSIRRMRYDPNDGSEAVDGVRALGRALEHLHLGWAFCGIALRLPGIWQSVQLLMDASGLGPRVLGDEL